MNHSLRPLVEAESFGLDRYYHSAPFRSARDLLSSFFTDSVFDYANRYELTEIEGGHELRVPLPGYKKADVTVELENDVLTISAKNAKASYNQSVTLWSGIDTAKIESALEDGMLLLSLPTSEASKPRKLAIK